jgi:hypothetical protein
MYWNPPPATSASCAHSKTRGADDGLDVIPYAARTGLHRRYPAGDCVLAPPVVDAAFSGGVLRFLALAEMLVRRVFSVGQAPPALQACVQRY